MLKIENAAENPHSITYAVASALDTEHLPLLNLKKIVDQGRDNRRPVVLDLHHVTLAGRESLHYPAGAKGRGLRITHLPACVRRWIALESGPSCRSGGGER
jgi:hypothetical protein